MDDVTHIGDDGVIATYFAKGIEPPSTAWANPTKGDVLITEFKDGKPMWYMPNAWQNTSEVCRWDVEDGSPTFAPHENEPTTTRETWLETMWERAQADVLLLLSRCRDGEVLSDSLLACYEELAGGHRELCQAFMLDSYALSTPCPGDPEDYTFVRAYYRPRRSKAANSAPCDASPTGDKEPATNPPNTSSGEATGQGWMIDEVPPEGFGDGVTVWACENCHKPVCRLEHECIPQSGEERSE